MNVAEAAIAGLFGGNGSGGGSDVTKAYVDEQDAKKTDKVTSATSGNFAGLDENGNLTDSGKKATDFATPSDVAGEDISATATGSVIALTDSADARVQGLTINGRSTKASETISNVGDGGSLTVTLTKTGETSRTATITTGLPLRSVAETIYDTLDKIKVVKKCGWIDLNSIYWEYLPAQTRFYAPLPNTAKLPTSGSVQAELLCAPYTTITFSQIQTGSDNNVIAGVVSGGDNYISIRDTRYTNASEFREALRGVYLVYELITPEQIALTTTEAVAMNALRTFDGATNISATDSPTMSVTYIKNTANGEAVKAIEDDLQGQITTLNTAKQPKTLDAPITIGGTSQTTVEAALGALNTAKQDKITQSATLTLTVADWDSTLKTQTVTFAHDTSKRNVIDITVSELGDWAACGVVAISETASGITFKCEEIPESALTFTVCSMSVASAN